MQKKLFIFLCFLSYEIISANDIKKVIVPCAGLGTRFFPYTKTIPKEMLPIDNKPAIHYIIEEALGAGIQQFSIIVNNRKSALRDYLTPTTNTLIQKSSRYHLIQEAEQSLSPAQFSYIDQNIPRGTGDAVLLAKPNIGDEYFALMYPDDLIFGDEPEIGQLIKVALENNASVIAVQEVPHEMTAHYGVIAIKEKINDEMFEISNVVEKPAPEHAPSNLAIIGRYVLSPKIFASIEAIAQNFKDTEIPLTDAIEHMMKTTEEKVIAYKVRGTRYDTGTPSGWVKAVIARALKNEDHKLNSTTPNL